MTTTFPCQKSPFLHRSLTHNYLDEHISGAKRFPWKAARLEGLGLSDVNEGPNDVLQLCAEPGDSGQVRGQAAVLAENAFRSLLWPSFAAWIKTLVRWKCAGGTV